METAVVLFGATAYFTGLMHRICKKQTKQKQLYKLAKRVAKGKKKIDIEQEIKEIMA